MIPHGACGYIPPHLRDLGTLHLFGSSLQIVFSVDTSIQLPNASPALSDTEPSITAIVRKLSPLPENSKWASDSGSRMSERRESLNYRVLSRAVSCQLTIFGNQAA